MEPPDSTSINALAAFAGGLLGSLAWVRPVRAAIRELRRRVRRLELEPHSGKTKEGKAHG